MVGNSLTRFPILFTTRQCIRPLCLVIAVVAGASSSSHGDGPNAAATFRTRLAPLLTERCAVCHHRGKREGGLSLQTRADWLAGGESGPVIEPGDADASLLVDYVSGEDPEMPQQGDPLTDEEVHLLRQWIDAGAPWPKNLELKPDPLNWWSLRPLQPVAVPPVEPRFRSWVINPIDAFVVRRLAAAGLTPSPVADRRTLIRRLSYDLIGLPPTPEEVRAFVADERPDAYQRLVDRLLSSPHYGERWARHWLDVVHYGETHGYDKDKPRPHAWPYRDYVIRSLNSDKPYSRFILEQLAGDVIAPEDPQALVATGFLSAGPWDFIGHVELSEEKLDGKIARNLDRDDMVTNTLQTFASLTVGCARCHDHKFDPVNQEDYYSLQAVFAAIDRVDRTYDADPETARTRRRLLKQQTELAERVAVVERKLAEAAGPMWKHVARLREIRSQSPALRRQAFGFHSGIEAAPDTRKWVQIDLGQSRTIQQVVIYPCHDDYNNIGDGFGFPVRWKVLLGNTPTPNSTWLTIADYSQVDFANPGVQPVTIRIPPQKARFVRIEATRLALRKGDYILALAEVAVHDETGRNVALGAVVTSLDSIEAPPRWRRDNLTDGIYYGQPDRHWKQWRDESAQRELRLAERGGGDANWQTWIELRTRLKQVSDNLAALPPQQRAYVGMAFRGTGNFRGTGGKPRDIFVLARGDVRSPLKRVGPGVPPLLRGVPCRFQLPEDAPEGMRRLRLAQWLIRPDHPLTWRSIVNRIWLYHFGQGIVETPNDFGRMGGKPSHPELLDYLALRFQESGGSWKDLHRLIVTSATYRQQVASRPSAVAVDAGNRLLWRANRRRLEAEAVRDSLLVFAGRLDRSMYGPSFRDFVIERPEHSPHYEYGKVDPADPRLHRRAVYRFIVRSQPQPMMQVFDCADPSMSVPQRQQTTTPQQALALLNNELSIWVAQRMAERLERTGRPLEKQIELAMSWVLQRTPDAREREWLTAYARKHGLPAVCRVLFNLNEVMFVD